MPLTSILSAEIRPDKVRAYEQLCLQLAERARSGGEGLRWTAHQSLFGASNQFFFVTRSEGFAGLAVAGRIDQTIRRVLGEEDGGRWLQKASECVVDQRHDVAVDRPELSYAPEGADTEPAYGLVTVVRARPGHQEAAEELIRKVAEAIPKTDDTIRLVTYQTVVGDLMQYFTVRPLPSLGDLDHVIAASELLTQAFGPSEGGLIYRSGMEAIERVDRAIHLYREELSNPSF